MADTVDTKVVFSGNNRYVVKLTNIGDGTGESGVTKVDISTLTGPDRVNAVARTVLEEVEWSISGYSSVRLVWDHTTDDEMVVLGTGNGYLSWKNVGGLVDPASAGDTGDILLTTAGNVAGATYDITLVLRLKN